MKFNVKYSKIGNKFFFISNLSEWHFSCRPRYNEKWLEKTGELNKEEKDALNKLEKIHKKPFPYKSVRGVLSSANRFGYSTNDRWFAISMFRNKFTVIDVATHELMHFMFHKYYWKTCSDKGLTWKQTWDVKEAFTVLLNLEFPNIRFEPDYGYPEHKKIREATKQSWKKHHDFDKALESAIKIATKKYGN